MNNSETILQIYYIYLLDHFRIERERAIFIYHDLKTVSKEVIHFRWKDGKHIQVFLVVSKIVLTQTG